MSESYFVYKHTTPSNKVYIGITMQTPEKRWKRGLGYQKQQSLFYNAIRKYGWDNIQHEILYKGLSKEEACRKEIELIAEYKSNDRRFGYNILEGGKSPKQPPEANISRSEKVKERWASAEYKERLSSAMKGVKRSPESCENIRKAQKQRFEDPSQRRKISEIQSGKTRSDEAKRKTSESLKKFYSNPENRKMLAEIRQESNRRAHGRKVLCVETGKIYETIVDASKETGIDHRNISAICKHKRKGKYTWEYVE